MTPQHLCVRLVQEYIRLIGPWCQINSGSCRFVLAQCYLANGEGQKVSPSHLSDGCCGSPILLHRVCYF